MAANTKENLRISWFLCYFLIFLTFQRTTVRGEMQCVKTGPCSCEMADGSGGIDLITLAEVGEPMVYDEQGRDLNFYSFNPCLPFEEPNGIDVCANVAVCMYREVDEVDTYYNCGEHLYSDFVYNNETGYFDLVYTGGYELGDVRHTIIHLVCGLIFDLDIQGYQEETRTVVMTMATPCACVTGCEGFKDLSAGSVLLIIFTVSLGFYFAAGAFYLHTVREKQGCDMIPHRHMWTELFSLIRDGCCFVLGPCRGNDPDVMYSQYERPSEYERPEYDGPV
ncbi:M6PR [Branchiostoma lanceolatum]|uniref:Autophagy-related protein 27 n=1 Tax=Branchiostoma lanceolatum TaxID=7740 RepID=A0A8K0F2Z5_BRALA|nr:M6PR [Branchiostoma lanceolatum]